MKDKPMLTKGMVILATVFSASAAFSAQQQNANLYVNWNTPTVANYTSLDQQLQITQIPAATFWATVWNWSGSSSGGYIGLQTDGTRADGTVGDTVIFSIWNATAAIGSCQPFAGEGSGYSCRLAYPFTTTKKYRLKLTKGSNTSNGQWWKASVVDTSTFKESVIGSLLAPINNTDFQLPRNFSEYFGAAVPSCADVPVSIANWSPARILPTGAYFTVTPRYQSFTRGSCTGGSATPMTISYQPVAQVKLGGPL